MKPRLNHFSQKAIRFLKRHFDSTVLIAVLAVSLISWVKFNSARFHCAGGNCIESTDGEYFSRMACERNCHEPEGRTNPRKSAPLNCKAKSNNFRVEIENADAWGDTMIGGTNWYASDLQQMKSEMIGGVIVNRGN